MSVRPYFKVAPQLTADLFTLKIVFCLCVPCWALSIAVIELLIISSAGSHLPFVFVTRMTSLLLHDKSPQI